MTVGHQMLKPGLDPAYESGFGFPASTSDFAKLSTSVQSCAGALVTLNCQDQFS